MPERVTTSTSPSTTVSPPQPISPSSLIDLHTMSSALSAFLTSINDLQLHLQTLKFSIETLIAKNPPRTSQIEIMPPPKPSSPQNSMSLFDFHAPSNNIVKKKSRKWEEPVVTVNSEDGVMRCRNNSVEELKKLCETMDPRGLRRYMINHLNDIGKLRLEVPKALKYAQNAAKLALDGCGRFFLQGKRAYENDTMMVSLREASVLILECFLMMEGRGSELLIDDDVKYQADGAVTLWRQRMTTEGGIMRACEIDARGLLLLLGCYGVPLTFRSDDLKDLFRASNVREMAGTLRRSSSLVERVPEIIELMIQNKLQVDAIDVAYTFGFEERCNIPTILTSFLQKIKEPSKKLQKSSASPTAVIDANREQLAVLTSFAKCLKGHKIDSSKIISGKEIQEKISRLEKDIFEYDKKIISEYDEKLRADKVKKRKADEEEAEVGRRSRFREEELRADKVKKRKADEEEEAEVGRRSRFLEEELRADQLKKRKADEEEAEIGRRSRFREEELSCFTGQLLSDYGKKITAEKLKKRKADAEGGRRSRFREEKLSRNNGQLLQPQRVGHHCQRSLFDTGMADHINGYSESQSMLHSQVPGTDYAAVGAYRGLDVDSSGHANNYGFQSYRRHADSTLSERLVTHSYDARPSSSSLSSLYRPDVDSSGHANIYGFQSYRRHADPTLTERHVTHRYDARPSSSSLSSLYRPESSSSAEGYVMLPSGSSISIPNRTATTDLYKFVDSVVDDEYHPTVVPSYHTSYPY